LRLQRRNSGVQRRIALLKAGAVLAQRRVRLVQRLRQVARGGDVRASRRGRGER
jgi:hypothetical protein